MRRCGARWGMGIWRIWAVVAPLALGLVLSLVLSAALVGCGGGSSRVSQPAQVVTITLSDYKITASRTTFVVGVPYHFVVANQSQSHHELMIMPPTSGNVTMNSAGDLAKAALYVVSQPQLPPGGSHSFEYTFKAAAAPGALELASHIGSDYPKGMRLPITVTKS